MAASLNTSGLENTRFFTGNFRFGIAQQSHMVERHIGHGSEARFHNVGGVEASAKSNLYHGIIDARFLEPFKCHYCRKLEKRRPARQIHGAITLHEIDNCLARHHLAVDADALAEIDKMGRRVQSGLVAGVPEYGGCHVRGRAFAVGASDMYFTVALVWIAERFGENTGRVKSRFICSRTL